MPPFRWRIKAVPFGIDYPVVVEDEAFDLDSHIWESALPVPGTDQQLGEAVGTSPRARSTGRGHCGSCTSSTAWPTAGWRW